MKHKTLALIKFLIGWPLSVVAFLFLFQFFAPQFSQIEKQLSRVQLLPLIFSLFIFLLYYFVRVILWREILKAKGHSVPLIATAWHWSIAEMNRYIPGNIWSIVGRGAAFGKYDMKQSVLFVAWTEESFLLILGSMLGSLLAISFLFAHIFYHLPQKELFLWLCILGSGCIGLCWIFQKTVTKRIAIFKKITLFSLDPKASAWLLALSFLSFVLFGCGTYLSVASLIALPLQLFGPLIGLFIFSFFVGYISILTPMGLGVREFTMAEGLVAFAARSLVGVVAIWSRLMLIVSELLFLCLACFLYKVQAKIVLPKLTHIKKHVYAYALWFGIALYVCYFLTATFLKYTNFYTGRFDLGNMDQTVWNTLHGRIFLLTDPNGTNTMSRLGTHADFLLVLLAPFYVLWQDPRMLLLIQTVVLALGAFFLYGITQKILQNKSIALVLGFAYLLNPSVQNTNLYDFHAVTLATTFFLAVWYFLQRKKTVWALVFLLLAALTKEQAWLVVAVFGVYFFFFAKKKLLGTAIAAISLALFYLLIWKWIPAARGGQHFALAYYSDFGQTPGQVIKNIILSPGKILMRIFGPTRLNYLFALFAPLGFLALFAPFFLLFALPDLLINLLSSDPTMQQIYYQYTAVITPFLFIATVYGIKNILQKYKKLSPTFFIYFLAITSFLCAYIYGPLFGTLNPNIDMFIKPQPNSTAIANFLQHIPKKLSVAATNNLGSHLSHRQDIYTIPVGQYRADIVAFLLTDAFAQPSLPAQEQMAEELAQNPKYREIEKLGDFVVFEKRSVNE